jgi:dihydrodipicolinate synthase/N-acetylneuraminate lyase
MQKVNICKENHPGKAYLFAGIYPILQTPFDETGQIDFASLERQIAFCLDARVHGVVLPAMASEFFALADKERFELVEFTIPLVKGRVPILIGVQAVSLPVALGFAEHAAKHGADGLMAMPPYLRKAPAADVETYYRALAQVGLPLMIQNAPAPVGSPLDAQTLARLMQSEPNIAYVKEETDPILQKIGRVVQLAGDACQGVFGGANGLFLVDELDRGAVGNMPAVGVVDIQVKIYECYKAGDRHGAEELQFRLLPLLSFGPTYGVSLHKCLLWRRGVLATRYARDPQQLRLDEGDERAIVSRWERVAADANPSYPLK